MSVNWIEIQKTLSPIKDFEEFCRQWLESFSYPFVREIFNISLPDLSDYTRHLLGEDPKKRYADYATWLLRIIDELQHAGVQDVLELLKGTETRLKFEQFAEQKEIPAEEIAGLLKYLFYWFIPRKKRLEESVRSDPIISDAVKVLHSMGVRFNLDMLQQGYTAAGRKALADSSKLPETIILELVNRADLSRMPWASKATISNIVGAGYGSIANLANADPEKLYQDFFDYGRAIGKNLKLGNEIEGSYRIAKIVPAIVQQG
jgi:hypothetical protein